MTELEKENEKLRGYEHIVQCLKEEGFDTFASVKDYINEHQRLIKENAELKEKVNEQSERIAELTQGLDANINRFG